VGCAWAKREKGEGKEDFGLFSVEFSLSFFVNNFLAFEMHKYNFFMITQKCTIKMKLYASA